VGAAAVLIGGLLLRALVPQSDTINPEAAAEAITLSRVEDLPQVVVRPFPELADNPSQILLARGFTARIITDLSRFPDLCVISPRTAASAEAEPAKGPGRYLVTGEIERYGDNIRVYIHLSEAAEGRTLWSEQYDRPYTDVFALQDELTRQILGVLRFKVSDAERLRQARPYTKSLPAYEAFLRAQSALIVRRQPENEEARRLYAQAIKLDPTFARAFAGLALTYAADHRNAWTRDSDAALVKASELARTAQQIDPDVAQIYFVLAYVAMERGKFTDAVKELRTALRFNPSYADAYALLGAIRTYGGRPGETVPLIHVAMKLVPDAGHLYLLILGRAYYFLGDIPSALAYLRQAIARNPDSLEVRVFLAAALVQAGRRDDAEWEREEIRQLDPAFRLGEWLSSYPMTDAKQIAQLTAALGSIGL
jgi:TolB-like protein/Flp pilus assembly protein TadD